MSLMVDEISKMSSCSFELQELIIGCAFESNLNNLNQGGYSRVWVATRHLDQSVVNMQDVRCKVETGPVSMPRAFEGGVSQCSVILRIFSVRDKKQTGLVIV